MKSLNLKKKFVLYVSIFSFCCLPYLNLFVNPEVAPANAETEIEQEERNTPKVLAPDLKVVSQFMTISKKVLEAIH